MKKIYKLNLRGVDVSNFVQNPLVCRDYHYSINDVVGKAKILKGKTGIEVEYFGEVPAYEHSIGASTSSYNYEKPVLNALAVISVHKGGVVWKSTTGHISIQHANILE